jgi:hypothetical protein
MHITYPRINQTAATELPFDFASQRPPEPVSEKRSPLRYRLTFFYENWRFRLVVDENAVQLTVDFGDRPLPTSMRKPSI